MKSGIIAERVAHNWKGWRNALEKMGIRGRGLKIAHSSRGAWRVAMALNRVLTNEKLRSYGMEVPEDLAQRKQKEVSV